MPDMTYVPGGSEPRQEPLGPTAYTPPAWPATPHAAPLPPKKRRVGLLAALIAAAVVVSIAATFLIVTLAGLAPWSDKQQAINACKAAITSQLKAPATAKFSGIQTDRSPAGGFDVAGTVDAENSFSALVRNTWTCYAYTDHGVWKTRAAVQG